MFHKFLILIKLILIFTIQLTAREIKFTFNPPDNLEYQAKIRITKTTELDGQHQRVEITESSVKVKTRKTDSEYIVTNTPGPTKHYRDGQETDHPIFSLLSKVIVTYHVDFTGQIISVNGFDKLRGLMQENLPPQLVQQLTP
ncbi:hypothetical protein JW964_19720, partial [candidate division KSB1 bacterium]|nr:hypothetical protein [candidate division KSB1 bacterium]